MARLQLALNVKNLEAAIAFYQSLFGAEPAKRRPGYANFALTNPPLKLVLIENPEAAERINHLGVEVTSTDEVTEMGDRLQSEGLAIAPEHQVTCCYAVQDKVWITEPEGISWEVYTVLQDADRFAPTPAATSTESTAPCCK
ncbi:ArsI/CadI family heavy metal resistance metalloenzyme [Vacuolonema iberomarrocanum]|uniref:ArsI/CadI family heavy metal resistance metalloenzyme n=1 Tax=Vacuolonema iberomarrocanum TaxID=3454632 RepID=UPI0019FEF388|nr:VOC family protein [filamentous cyanobacterium LEGE 07170]